MEIEKVEEHLMLSWKKADMRRWAVWYWIWPKDSSVGEKFQIEGLEITIENADERSIKKVKIKKIKTNSLNEE